MIIRSFIAACAMSLALPAFAQDQKPAETEQQAEKPAPVLVDDIALGAEDAPLTIIEYASFTCGHCANFHAEGWQKLKSEYVDTGKVRFIQRDVYFDQVGLWAGILARCGGDDKYYAVSDMLLSEQKKWLEGGSGDEIAANLRKIGLKAGMTEEQMTACWNDSAKAESLVATFQKNVTDDDVEATPTFIIDGEKVMNQPWDDLKKIIEDKLAAK